MSIHIDSAKEIPQAYCYVLAHDTFMSGWGQARGLINTVILPCETFDIAKHVADYAESRSDMKNVRIAWNKPRLTPGHYYSLMCAEEATAWYPQPEGNG